jgi:1-acyl-sn-glycerol-3-phosphate acyltransferase
MNVTSRRPSTPPAYTAIARIVRPALMALTKRDWSGAENLPESGGFVVCPNHISYADILAFAHVLYDNGHPPYFLGKEGVFRVPALGHLLRAAEQVPVYRESGAAAGAFRAAVDAVGEGKAVVIYPEGTLTREPDMWPMRGKTGAARVALETGCPVIPVAQWGPQEILARYGKRPAILPRKTMHVRVGPPVDLSDMQDTRITKLVLDEATERIMAAITHELEQIRGETAPRERFDPKAHGLAATGNYTKQQRRQKEGR